MPVQLLMLAKLAKYFNSLHNTQHYQKPPFKTLTEYSRNTGMPTFK